MTAVTRRISINIFTNTLSTLLNALCGFIILPFLIIRFGRETYGFWTLIVASVGYFMVLDFGISTAVGRLIAAYRARNDIGSINIVLSTSMTLLVAVCGVVMLLTFLIQFPFFWLFDVPAAQQQDVSRALITMGWTSALYFPALVPFGLLWGYERFDLINAIEIPMVLGRTALTLLLIHENSQLSTLAFIVAGASVAAYVARIFVCWWIEPRLALRPRLFSRAVFTELFSFGVWFSALGFFRSIMPNVASFVIGHMLGPAAVTTFTIPRLLVAYTNWVMVSATQVMAPKAAVYHFGEHADHQKELFLVGGQYNWALTLFFVGGAVLFGSPLLDLWQGGPQHTEYRLLLILMFGEAIPLSQWITYNTAVSMGRHRRLAIFGLIEALCILIFGSLAVTIAGLDGIAVVAAIAALIFRGLLQMDYGRRLIKVSLAQYVRTVFLTVTAISVGPFVLTALTVLWLKPQSWSLFVAESAIYGALYWGCLAGPLHFWRRSQIGSMEQAGGSGGYEPRVSSPE